MIIFSLLLILAFLSFPILLWGYGMIYLSENLWNKNRFIFGMIGGAISVTVIALFGKSGFEDRELLKIVSFGLIFFVIGSIVWWITRSGSPFIRGFLRRAILLHTMIFCGVFIITMLLKDIIIPPSKSFLVFLTGLGSFFIAASIEEGVKHVSTLGLTAKEFRFTRRDFLIFTFFVTLGFSTFENAIYLFQEIDNGPWVIFLTGIARILFSLTIHVFAAAICVMMWWKALSYEFFSINYILLFLLGYIGAILIHGAFNVLLEGSYIIPIIVLTGVGYFSFTQWIMTDEGE